MKITQVTYIKTCFQLIPNYNEDDRETKKTAKMNQMSIPKRTCFSFCLPHSSKPSQFLCAMNIEYPSVQSYFCYYFILSKLIQLAIICIVFR